MREMTVLKDCIERFNRKGGEIGYEIRTPASGRLPFDKGKIKHASLLVEQKNILWKGDRKMKKISWKSERIKEAKAICEMKGRGLWIHYIASRLYYRVPGLADELELFWYYENMN